MFFLVWIVWQAIYWGGLISCGALAAAGAAMMVTGVRRLVAGSTTPRPGRSWSPEVWIAVGFVGLAAGATGFIGLVGSRGPFEGFP